MSYWQVAPGFTPRLNPALTPRVAYTPEHELDALIAAGLGNVERCDITPDMHRRAMAGEIVKTIPPKRQRTNETPSEQRARWRAAAAEKRRLRREKLAGE